jgi:hypothetical protein
MFMRARTTRAWLVTAVVAGTATVSGCAGEADDPAPAGAAAAAAPAALPTVPPDVEAARTALAKYQDPVVALRDGYLSTVACIEFPGGGDEGGMDYRPGAMGVHFLNPANIGPTLDPLKPQILLYEWAGDSLRLTGAEWFVPVAVLSTAPAIFGKTLDGPMEGHPPILPTELHHWDLHVWMWKDNPNGLFHPTNPAVTCPPRRYTFREHPPKMVHVKH